MGNEPTTPDPEQDPTVDDLPPETPEASGEQVDETDEPAQADQSAASGTIAQAEYTRVTQQNAAIRKELGLPKGATTQDILAAIAERVAADEDEEDEVPEDPRIAEANQRAFDANFRVAQAIYGQAFAEDAIQLANTLRSTDDVDEIMVALAGFRDAHGQAAVAAAAPAGAETATDGDTGSAEQVIDTSEGDRAPAPRESTPPGRRESGVVGALRGIFAEAGVNSRGPRQPSA